MSMKCNVIVIKYNYIHAWMYAESMHDWIQHTHTQNTHKIHSKYTQNTRKIHVKYAAKLYLRFTVLNFTTYSRYIWSLTIL